MYGNIKTVKRIKAQSIANAQFYRIKGGGHAGSRIHKFSSTFSKVIGDGGGGGGVVTPPPPFIL